MIVLSRDQTSSPGAAPVAGCGLKSADLPRAKPISVNGVVVSRVAVARETQNHPAEKAVDAWRSAARALVVRELLLQEARRLAIGPAPAADDEGRRETDEEALVRQLVEREVTVPKADEATCRRIYDTQTSRFRSADLYEVRHILIAAAPSDTLARERARAEALSVIAAVVDAPSRFSELAAACSACPSRAQGGSLGQISRGQTVPEFEAALPDAPIGAVCSIPIESRYGFHVVMVDRRIEGRTLPFELVHRQIAEWLEERGRLAAIRQYIGHLAGRATITGIDLTEDVPSQGR